MATKRVNLDAKFMQKATTSPGRALAYMFTAGFGVDLLTVGQYAKKMISEDYVELINLCIAASIQVRGNVTFANLDMAKLAKDYPMVLIDGNRGSGLMDNYNFSMLHAIGHALASYSSNKLAAAAMKKAGNCVRGPDFPDTTAGKINREIYLSWSEDDKTEVSALLSPLAKQIDDAFKRVEVMAAEFKKA